MLYAMNRFVTNPILLLNLLQCRKRKRLFLRKIFILMQKDNVSSWILQNKKQDVKFIDQTQVGK